MNHMPMSMVNARMEIIHHLYDGKNISQIRQLTGHGRDLIRKVKMQLEQGDNMFLLNNKIGAPAKRTKELEEEVIRLVTEDRRAGLCRIAKNVTENGSPISKSLVANILHDNHFNYLPPRKTFLLSEKEKQARVSFCNHHLLNNTDWISVLFNDESLLILGPNRRWLWRRRGEIDQCIYSPQKKYPQKFMVFGGISYNYHTPLIALTGTINAQRYVSDCIQRSQLITGMNEIYGEKNWVLMQNGASIHTSSLTNNYLEEKCNILKNWPANSPDLNPIENLWAIMKDRVEQVEPNDLETLKQIVFDVWNNIKVSTIQNLINSMDDRLRKVVKNGGAPNGY